MLPVSVAPILTPHSRLTLVQDHDAAAVEAEFAQRVQSAFARGSGHGLLQLGANEVGMALPATLSFWREFAATYVTTVCTRLGPVRERRNLHVPVPANSELDQFVLSAPPMTGAEYLTAAVLRDLWQELDRAFEVELSEANCGIEEFLKRRNPAWNLVGRVHFNLAENRKDEAAPFAFLATLHNAALGACQGPTHSAGPRLA
jgi:hypothetical protein